MPKGFVGKPFATCHPDRVNHAKGLCNSCYNKHHSTRWARAHPELRAGIKYKSNLKRLYGLTPEAYKEMYDAQQGLCALGCGRPIDCVDHSHESEEVRGLLCKHCNWALGHFNDDPELMLRAAGYVRRHAVPTKELHTSGK